MPELTMKEFMLESGFGRSCDAFKEKTEPEVII
jgi:hypothetical protein